MEPGHGRTAGHAGGAVMPGGRPRKPGGPASRGVGTTAKGLGQVHQKWRKALLAEMTDGSPCPGCGRPMFKTDGRQRWIHLHHRVPRSKGGATNRVNCVLVCSKCNLAIGDRMVRVAPPVVDHRDEPGARFDCTSTTKNMAGRTITIKCSHPGVMHESGRCW